VERSWIADAEVYLEDLYQRTVEHRQLQPKPDPLAKEPLTEHEAEYFMRGLEAGLFSVDINSYVQSPLMPAKQKKHPEQRMCQLVWSGSPAHFFRESICQLATTSSLILEHGWPASLIEMEPCKGNYKEARNGVDLVAKSVDGSICLAVEAKSHTALLNDLIEGFKYCCALGDHPKNGCRFEGAHSKYRFCRAYRPVFFWAVAPTQDICFRLGYDENEIRLEEVPLDEALAWRHQKA
jgi:hypothetical protein